MARKLRTTSAGIYHVSARAPIGELLFRDEHDFLRFETEVERVLSEQCVCIAACVLNTHYHLILQTEDGVLAQAMKQVNQRYARAFNSRYARRGHAFADRYLSVPVESDGHLLTVYRYVVRNPVEAGLCDSPADWYWSSYREAIGLDGRFKFAATALVIGLFHSIDAFRAFVESPWASDRTAGSDPKERGQTPKHSAA